MTVPIVAIAVEFYTNAGEPIPDFNQISVEPLFDNGEVVAGRDGRIAK